MDPVAGGLAALRLARVQCTSWGHPNTSGYPTVDYFLSSDLMEPAGADAHYTERLIRLPNLSIYYDPPPAHGIAGKRSDRGMREGATVFWCGQSLFKYLPQYDAVFPRIALGLDGCQFVFIEDDRMGTVTEQFRSRLERSFSAAGRSAAEHCLMLPRMEQEAFVATIGLCDAVLDSIGWSGCNSTLEALAHDLPAVTMAGDFMRGRHTMAILTVMGVAETVAADLDRYVDIAVRLGRDAQWCEAVRRKIAANKHRVYRDRAPVTALEEFFDRVARAADAQ
jgi:predicted O-linked N-acetylglucosamine transferase (SPINDLY family)